MKNVVLDILAVGLGGFIGATARYGVCELVNNRLVKTGFPYGTLIVNLLGCLVIGLLGGWASTASWLSSKVKLFLIIGILGSFTTFSTFGHDTLMLVQGKQSVAAMGNVVSHMVLGLLFVYAGYSCSASL